MVVCLSGLSSCQWGQQDEKGAAGGAEKRKYFCYEDWFSCAGIVACSCFTPLELPQIQAASNILVYTFITRCLAGETYEMFPVMLGDAKYLSLVLDLWWLLHTCQYTLHMQLQ